MGAVVSGAGALLGSVLASGFSSESMLG
jgi:hypothetical protein